MSDFKTFWDLDEKERAALTAMRRVHHGDVEAVCSKCHHKRGRARANQAR
jgi:hypothetical protein